VIVPVLSQGRIEKMATLPVERFIKDGTESLQKIVIVTTQSGVHLQVSLNHPLLTQDYTMKKAQDLKAGDSLIKADGRPDVIVDVRTEDYYGKLHNLTVATSDMSKSLYLVQGYISGDKKFQDTALSDVNRRIFRSLVK
jgi:intein/homing endonuclease